MVLFTCGHKFTVKEFLEERLPTFKKDILNFTLQTEETQQDKEDTIAVIDASLQSAEKANVVPQTPKEGEDKFYLKIEGMLKKEKKINPKLVERIKKQAAADPQRYIYTLVLQMIQKDYRLLETSKDSMMQHSCPLCVFNCLVNTLPKKKESVGQFI